MFSCGNTASNRADIHAAGFTLIDGNNPASATGIITSGSIYWDAKPTETCAIGSFYISGGSMHTRGWSSLALPPDPGLQLIAAGTDFTAFEIQIGDFIGIGYDTTGAIDITTSGSSYYSATSPLDWPWSSHGYSAGSFTMSLVAVANQLGFINVGDAWKEIQNIYINVGDTWKSLAYTVDADALQINIGDVWKNFMW